MSVNGVGKPGDHSHSPVIHFMENGLDQFLNVPLKKDSYTQSTGSLEENKVTLNGNCTWPFTNGETAHNHHGQIGEGREARAGRKVEPTYIGEKEQTLPVHSGIDRQASPLEAQGQKAGINHYYTESSSKGKNKPDIKQNDDLLPLIKPDSSAGTCGLQWNKEMSSFTAMENVQPQVALAPAEQLWSTSRDCAVKLRVSKSGPCSEAPMTIYQMFQETVRNYGELPALAAKKDGNWEMLTYREYYHQCRAAAKSFLKLGLERYHGVGILGFNSPEWFIADIGCILAGGLAVGIYVTNSPEACQYVANNCEANVLVVENHKQLIKILKVKDQLPHLKAIVQYKDELEERLPNLYTWNEFLKLGVDVTEEALNNVIKSQVANECCSLIYTSGTTGHPKGVMLSHDNITWIANAAGTISELKQGEQVLVSYLPLSHVAAQVNDMWICMRFAGITYFAEPDALKGSLVNTLRDVRPTTFLGVPRVWEKMQEKMKAMGAKASMVRRKVATWAKSIGLQASYNAMNGSDAVPWGYMLANNLVFKKVRVALGLDRCKACYTGAAPITKDTLEYFMSFNIPLYELYGMSESTGPHTVSLPSANRIMSCGKEIYGCCTKLDKPDEDGTGEICFFGRHVFMGYLGMLEQTKSAVDQEGWLHSGDLGKHDKDGFLFITGRIKELIITAGGENIPPVPIEDAMKEELPIISNAMLVGDKRKFLSVLLTLKGEPTDELAPATVDFWRQRGLTVARISDLTTRRHPAIFKAIQEGIDRVNIRATSNAQKVQKWMILERDFSISGGELGPTMKLKRPIVHKMYKEKIDKFYAE